MDPSTVPIPEPVKEAPSLSVATLTTSASVPEPVQEAAPVVSSPAGAPAIFEVLRRPNSVDLAAYDGVGLAVQAGVPRCQVLLEIQGVKVPAVMNMTASAARAAGLKVLSEATGEAASEASLSSDDDTTVLTIPEPGPTPAGDKTESNKSALDTCSNYKG